MTVLIGFISLAVDFGRVQCAKTELQNACDAAARYAVTGLRDNTAVSKAQSAASQNLVDGSTLSLTTADIQTGSWNTSTRLFTAGGSPQNAVRVTGRRTQARGNPVPLMFARAIGRSTCDVNAVTVASQLQLPYSLVALNNISMSGLSTIGPRPGEGIDPIVASNGTWSMASPAAIDGDVLYRGTAPTGTISGTKTAMSANISYAPVSTPGGTQFVGAVDINSGNFPLPGGASYSASSVLIGGTANFSVTGHVNVYCSGNFRFGDNCTIDTDGVNRKMTIYMTGSGTITFTNNKPVHVVIYAPNSDMTVNATGTITGSFVVKSLNMVKGNIQYSSYLPIPVSPTGGGGSVVVSGVSTVK